MFSYRNSQFYLPLITLASLLAACSESGRRLSDNGDQDSASTVGMEEGGETDDPPTTAGGRLDSFDEDDELVDCDDPGANAIISEDFTFAWIANTTVGELSKIDANTMEELARYKTFEGPYNTISGIYVDGRAGAGAPSRTSVALNGDAVVANRRGGVAKFFARVEDCAAHNGNGQAGLQTSDGADNVLDWGGDDCLAWSYEYPDIAKDLQIQRAVAWTAGEPSVEKACVWVNQKVWTTISELGTYNSARVLLLSGDSGELEAEVAIPEIEYGNMGPYGGAVDADNNFWISGYNNVDSLVKVNIEDMSYEIIEGAPYGTYGMTLDGKGRVWLATDDSVARYDPATDMWKLAYVPAKPVTVDIETETAWAATSDSGFNHERDGWGLLHFNSETMEFSASDLVDNFVKLRDDADFGDVSDAALRGVGIDFSGRVWLVDTVNSAMRYDPVTGTIDEYSNLDRPYTYSDFLGTGLSAVTNPTG